MCALTYTLAYVSMYLFHRASNKLINLSSEHSTAYRSSLGSEIYAGVLLFCSQSLLILSPPPFFLLSPNLPLFPRRLPERVLQTLLSEGIHRGDSGQGIGRGRGQRSAVWLANRKSSFVRSSSAIDLWISFLNFFIFISGEDLRPLENLRY